MGGSLAAITAPHVPTVLVVRNAARAERIRRHGIEVEGKLEAVGRPEVVESIDDLADIHPIDLVVIATKTTAIPAVCAAMAPHLRDLPYLVSYQNGIEPAQTIIDTLGMPRVLRMVLNYGGRLSMRRIRQTGCPGRCCGFGWGRISRRMRWVGSARMRVRSLGYWLSDCRRWDCHRNSPTTLMRRSGARDC